MENAYSLFTIIHALPAHQIFFASETKTSWQEKFKMTAKNQDWSNVQFFAKKLTETPPFRKFSNSSLMQILSIGRVLAEYWLKEHFLHFKFGAKILDGVKIQNGASCCQWPKIYEFLKSFIV
jgi:hypothetical protein